MENNYFISNDQQIQSLKEIYSNIQGVFKKEGIAQCRRKCREVHSYIEKYCQRTPIRTLFDQKKHRISSTLIKDYFQLRLEKDSNIDFGSYQPVDILNDGSVLFRAISYLTGYTNEEDVLLLRLRCLVDALVNLYIYSEKDDDLQNGLHDNEKDVQSYWSDFICERDKVNFNEIFII